MAGTAAATSERMSETALVFLREVFGKYHPRNFSVRLWNGFEWGAEEGQDVRFTLVLNHPGALRRMFLPLNELSLGDAYIHGDYDIEGDIESALALRDHLLSSPHGFMERLQMFARLLSLPLNASRPQGSRKLRLEGERHSRGRDLQAVRYHYDLSNDFFASFLDTGMQYSCAYFRSLRDDLDTAQRQKLDYICRKVRLQPGDRLLDIGCGWGGLLMHAVTRYDADAVGITLSQAQADLARKRIKEAGLRHLCHVQIADYRDFTDYEGYHKIVSVGMVEHVGEARLADYFRKAWELLTPGGVFLNHGISQDQSRHGKSRQAFIDRHVFPDSERIPIGTVLRVAESCGFEVRDVESLREHYLHTLRHWVRRIEENRERILKVTDETTWRTWRLYMAGSAHGFKAGYSSVFQTLLVKPNRGVSGFPLTRDDWYARAADDAVAASPGIIEKRAVERECGIST